MIDIHSHILPGVDDGAKCMEDSLEMLEMAAAAGTTDIVATPHANSKYEYDRDSIIALARELQSRSRAGVNIHTGCDFHLSYENLQALFDSPLRFCINSGPYMLVEFNDLAIPPSTEQIFDQLLARGIVPIVTHPERNAHLRRDLDRLARWVRGGAYLQVTGQSLLGQFGQEAASAASAMIEAGLVHFVASDAHDARARTTKLDGAFALVASRWSTDLATCLCRHFPVAVIAGAPLDRGPLPRPRPAKRWFEFWR